MASIYCLKEKLSWEDWATAKDGLHDTLPLPDSDQPDAHILSQQWEELFADGGSKLCFD
jgi:hypothetical protein